MRDLPNESVIQPRAWEQCRIIAGKGLKPLLFGLLVAGSGKILFGEFVGLLLAIGVGMIVGCLNQGLVGTCFGGCWGAKSVAVDHVLEGSIVLPVLYTAAAALAVVCFAKSVHATWRQGLATAQADYEYFYGNDRNGQV